MTDGFEYYCQLIALMNSFFLKKKKKENTRYQIFGFVLLICLSLQFVMTFLAGEINLTNIPLWGGEWGDMIGVILFNFVLVLAIPAICHEKKSELSIQKGMSILLPIKSFFASIHFYSLSLFHFIKHFHFFIIPVCFFFYYLSYMGFIDNNSLSLHCNRIFWCYFCISYI